MRTLNQIAESYIPDPSTIDPSGRIVDSKQEIAEALLLALPYDPAEDDGDYSVHMVHQAICERIESIREGRYIIARLKATKSSDEFDALVSELGATVEQDWDAETTRLVLATGTIEWDGPTYTWRPSV